MTKTRRTFGQWFNHRTWCKFWGCQPPDDGTWWHAQNGMVVLTPETKTHCARCGGQI